MSEIRQGPVTDREKTTILMILLSRQLAVWIDHARQVDHVSHDFKKETGLLMPHLNKFNKFFDRFGEKDDNEEIYEQSITLSDFIEELLKLDANDIVRVTGLIDKIKSEKLKRQEYATS
jgi:hypothetical protein